MYYVCVTFVMISTLFFHKNGVIETKLGVGEIFSAVIQLFMYSFI